MGADDVIRAAIEAAGGAIAFREFQRLALYSDAGFYGSHHAGRRTGAFITSPEVGPLFGTVLARFLDDTWARLGRPDPFTVVEAGAARGTLARSILAAAPACRSALRYVAVEVADSQRAEHPADVESRADLPPGPVDGVVLANELLDNIPFRLAVFDGRWREAYVAVDGQRFVEVLSAPLELVPEVLPDGPPHGARVPLIDEAAGWLVAARGTLRRGVVLAFDYARPTTAELVALPWRDWLRTYRGHARADHYLAAPGSQDITIDVPLDQLPEPDAVRSQAQFLRRYGVDDLVEEGRVAWADGAAAGSLAALRMRSRVAEAEALLDPAGLGGFVAMEWNAAGSG